jgi:hypothetical protein
LCPNINNIAYSFVITVFSILVSEFCIFVLITMKPIPLAAYKHDLCPPVTGIHGSPVPVANSFDSSGIFQARGWAGSVKRRRNEEVDVIYDLSEDYPPLQMPQRQKLDTEKIKRLMVGATAMANDLRPTLTEENVDPKTMMIAKLSIALFDAVTAVIECGVVPLSSTANGRGEGGFKVPPPPPPKPAAPAGLKELREGLEKADRESILFDADLGTVTMANRKNLAAAFSAGIRSAAVAGARAANEDPAEAVRVMDDALSVVQDMDFIGAASKPFKGKTEQDLRNGKFCTMPIKFKFEDRDSRIHFETAVRKYCTLKASMSLPRPIREEQRALQKIVSQRYPDEIVAIRIDTLSMAMQAYRKKDGEKQWTKCPESVKFHPETLLPNYSSRSVFDLPPVALCAPEADGATGGEMVAEVNMESY